MMEHNFDFERGSRENPFGVPEGYFEDFCKRIETMTTPKKISLLQRIEPYRYAAAVVVVAVAIGAFLYNYNNSGKLEAQQSQTIAASEYNDVINKILIEETNDDMIVDYILAEVD